MYIYIFLTGIKSSELIFYYDETKQLLTIRKPGVNMGEEWIIAF